MSSLDRNVLNYVLQDVGFWSRNHGLKDRERIVWLLLYDMQGRKFARRGDIVTIKTRDRIFKVRINEWTTTKLFGSIIYLSIILVFIFLWVVQAVGLRDIENALLEVRTHLAASMSRLRIAGSALTLGKSYISLVVRTYSKLLL